MTKRQNTIYGFIILLIGTLGGIFGTAFTMGAERQRINDTLIRHGAEIAANDTSVQQEMDRYAEIMSAQMVHLQECIRALTSTINALNTDVQVIKALMERMEIDLKEISNSN